MLMSASSLLAQNPHPSEEEARTAIQGNICRCTGYVNIVEAIVPPEARHEHDRDHHRARRAAEGAQSASRFPRKEDKRLVQGQGIFFDDVRRHGMGYVHFVRSPHAHAKIVSIDVSAALELDGVYGTLTGDEVAIQTDPFFEMSVPPGANIKDYALAVGKVRFMGEPVAAVCARTRELARDAAELVEVEYEPLDVLVDAREAVKNET
jgi:2-furoyl-CoA dehydrogenase large subunit